MLENATDPWVELQQPWMRCPGVFLASAIDAPPGRVPFQGYCYSTAPGSRHDWWCGLHELPNVKARVPLMPLLPYDESDYTEEILYDCDDVFGYIEL